LLEAARRQEIDVVLVCFWQASAQREFAFGIGIAKWTENEL